MKRILGVLAFLAITLLSTNQAIAQENSSRRSPVEANAFTRQLVQEFNITKEQQHAVSAAYMYMVRQTNAVKTNVTDKNEAKSKLIVIDATFDDKLKTILTKVQYNKFKLKKQ